MSTNFKAIFLASFFIPGLLLLASVGHAADIQERNLRFAFQNPKDHPQGLGAQKFADLVSEKSDGKITVTLFPGGTLGGDLQTVSAMQGGIIGLTVLNAGLLSGLIKEFAVYDFPFLFNNKEEAFAVVDGPFGKQLLEKLSAKGLIGLGYWDLGFRNVTNNRRPIAKLEDIQGLKIRVLQAPIYIDLFNTLGANAVPMPFPELYTAIETGAVDGQENPVTVIQSGQFHEVQKYLSLTQHTYNPQALLISKRIWDQLSEDERKIIQEAASEATAYQREVSIERETEALEALKEDMEVNEVPPEEIEKMREKVKPVIEKHSQEVGEELVKELYAELEKVRGGQ